MGIHLAVQNHDFSAQYSCTSFSVVEHAESKPVFSLFNLYLYKIYFTVYFSMLGSVFGPSFIVHENIQWGLMWCSGGQELVFSIGPK